MLTEFLECFDLPIAQRLHRDLPIIDRDALDIGGVRFREQELGPDVPTRFIPLHDPIDVPECDCGQFLQDPLLGDLELLSELCAALLNLCQNMRFSEVLVSDFRGGILGKPR